MFEFEVLRSGSDDVNQVETQFIPDSPLFHIGIGSTAKVAYLACINSVFGTDNGV